MPGADQFNYEAALELVRDDVSFVDAITDIVDTLSYATMTDAQIEKAAGTYQVEIRTQRLRQKRAIAQQACQALRSILSDFGGTNLSPREAAIASALHFETRAWVESRAEVLSRRDTPEAWAEHRAELAADMKRDDELMRRAA
jgi:hypothetical protein